MDKKQYSKEGKKQTHYLIYILQTFDLLRTNNLLPLLRLRKKCIKNMNQEKDTNWKPLYIALLAITVLMIVAMLLFQNYYK